MLTADPGEFSKTSARAIGRIYFYGYVFTFIMSIAPLFAFVLVKNVDNISNYLVGVLGWVVMLAILSLANLIPFGIFASIWARKLKSQTTIEAHQVWRIIGGATGLVIPMAGFWWFAIFDLWDEIVRNVEPSSDLGQVSLGLILVPPIQVLGIVLGIVIGGITGNFDERFGNKLATASFFLVLVVLVSTAVAVGGYAALLKYSEEVSQSVAQIECRLSDGDVVSMSRQSCHSAGGREATEIEAGLAAYERHIFSTAMQKFQPLAEQGNAEAQFYLGVMFAKGQGVVRDDVQAYMWYDLAASRLPPGELRTRAMEGRDTVEEGMTPAQIAEARKLAREWQEKHQTPE